GEIRAFDASDDGTLWMMVERRTLHAVSLDGTPLVTLTQPATMPYVGHHDVTSRFGQTLMVHARTEQIGTGTWIVDGLTEIRDGVAEPVFTFSDAVVPRLTSRELLGYWGNNDNGPVQGIDFGHANSIDIDRNGRWLMSFKHLDSVFAFEGAASSPDRGAVLFSVVGGFRGLDDGDYEVVDAQGQAEGFEFPHHARWLDDNRISLVDNGRDAAADEPQEPTRVLVLELDDEAGRARVEQEYVLDAFCPIQSSAYTLPDGSMLIYCQRDARLWVFDEDARLQRASRVACADETISVKFPRILPLDRDYAPLLP
ncbi:MAG: arylsulfotransferase family protein, partial [Myxococcota bacterium]